MFRKKEKKKDKKTQLVECRACSKQVSKLSYKCQSCGHPTGRARKDIKYFFVLYTIFGFVSIVVAIWLASYGVGV